MKLTLLENVWFAFLLSIVSHGMYFISLFIIHPNSITKFKAVLAQFSNRNNSSTTMF